MEICRLGEICTRLSSGQNKTAEAIKEYGQYPVYGGNGIRGYCDEYNFDGECAIIGRQGANCGNVHYHNGKAYMTDHAIICCLNDRNNTHYIAYYLSLMNLGQLSGQAAQPGISVHTLSRQFLKMPSLDKQNRIVAILSQYDNLIENNQKRIKLLEQMAQQLYKEWFVRFRFPGYEKAKFVDGIPQGWEIVPIGTQCDVVGGATPSTNVPSNWNGDIKWVTPTDITRNNALPLIDIEGRITMKGLKSCATKLLPPETILMTSRASIGYIGLTKESVCTNQGFISVLPNHPNMKMYFVYMLLSRRDELINYANGSTFLEISRSNFKKLKMLLPSENILHQFENITARIFDEEYALEQQNKNLTKQRDLILPRLMSGKLAV